jgi:hypothetical protein
LSHADQLPPPARGGIVGCMEKPPIRLALNPHCPTSSIWWDSGGCELWDDLLLARDGEVALPAAAAHAWLARARALPGWRWPDPPVLAVEDAEEGPAWSTLPVAWWAPAGERN